MIKRFSPSSNEYKALEAVAAVLNSTCTNGYTFTVDDVYFDLSQNWMWTTISAEKNNDFYQVLCPRDHELITENICWTRMSQAVNNIISDSNARKFIAKF